MFRKLIFAAAVAATLAGSMPAVSAYDYFDDASNNEIIAVYQELNGHCRRGSGDTTMAWCGVRDLLFQSRMDKRNLCFGKKSDASSADMYWHICGKDSLR